MITEDAETRTRRYRGVSYTRPIDEAKRLVTAEGLAERLSGVPGVRRGREIAFRCPLHDDHDPSLRVDPDKGVWFCDPCLMGGDVVELARLAWGYDERDAHVAAAMLLMEFGHEVPQRPRAWYRRQDRQKEIRGAIDQERIEHIRLLVFRLIWIPWLKRLPEWSREEATQSAWERSRSIALRLYEQRRAA
jgi:hypothetical protein